VTPLWARRPNKNAADACCKCGKILPTPANIQDPKDGELEVHQPNATDPPQWMCAECAKGYE